MTFNIGAIIPKGAKITKITLDDETIPFKETDYFDKNRITVSTTVDSIRKLEIDFY